MIKQIPWAKRKTKGKFEYYLSLTCERVKVLHGRNRARLSYSPYGKWLRDNNPGEFNKMYDKWEMVI